MNARLRSARVVFGRPFVLAGLDGIQPAGVNGAETSRRPGRLFSLFTPLRPSTWIRIRRGHGLAGKMRLTRTDPGDLARALSLDAAPI
jgi:hypothetical protein